MTLEKPVNQTAEALLEQATYLDRSGQTPKAESQRMQVLMSQLVGVQDS